ncbi:hypothetical protein ACB094_03G075200 [Castanea mollissima]
MEPNENQLTSYYHHHQHQHQHHQNPTSSPTNGLLPPGDTVSGAHLVYPPQSRPPSSSSSAAAVTTNTATTATATAVATANTNANSTAPNTTPSSGLEGKRKRGRPRKYGTPEQALAAKKAAAAAATAQQQQQQHHHHHHQQQQQQQQQTTSSHSTSSSKERKEPHSSSSKKSNLLGSGNAGQGFTPHVISVAAGEDVGQKIMMFMQQSKREICILSASGSISNASLRQPATSGGNITYEGRFEIISLSGSYVRTELGGRTGGLSICLSSTDGQIIGGGVGGPLKAAGPVQVIVGTFMLDTKKDVNAGMKVDASASRMASPVGGASVSSIGFHSAVDSSGSHFMIQPRAMHVTTSRPTDWRGGPAAGYELTGRTGRGAHQSPENGDYEQLPD